MGYKPLQPDDKTGLELVLRGSCSYLSKKAKDEEPEGARHPSHAGGAEGEGNNAVVLSKHIHRRRGGAHSQEAVETCMPSLDILSSTIYVTKLNINMRSTVQTKDAK